MLVSNTRASFDAGTVTNYGHVTFVNSVSAFTNGNVYNGLGGTWTLDPSTNSYAGNFDNAGTTLLTNSVNNIASNLINDATGLYSMVQTSATYVAGVLTNLGTFNILSGSVLTNGNAVLSGGATVLVSDTGSVWSNNQLTLKGNLNSVVATNGGQLFGKGAITFDTAGYGNTITMGGGLWISPTRRSRLAAV